MGVDIVYFVDHDLPMESASSFLKEFNKRIKGNIHWNVYADTDICSFDNYFPNTQGDVCITFYNENEKKITIDLSLARRTLQIFELPGWDKIDCYRWDTVNKYLSNNKDFAETWTKNLIYIINEKLVPIFHSTKLILLKDSSSYEHEKLYNEILLEKGGTIEDVISYNSTFEHPCTILQNADAFGHSSNVNQPIYIFDL